MKGKLIVIEGLDSCGKATQTKLIAKKLEEMNYKVKLVTFPDYDSDSSALVKMYLNGEISEKAEDVNAYAASSFYAVDRFVSYKTKWEKKYLDDYTIVFDRYVTANMIHQASKFSDEAEKRKFIDWLLDFEYGLYGLPEPTVKLFLDVPPEISARLMKERLNKFSGEAAKDIHERDADYLYKTYENAKFIASNYGFKIINCVKDGNLRSIEDIQNEIREIADGI